MAKTNKKKGYVKGRTKPKIIIDIMNLRVGNENIYSGRGLTLDGADALIKGMRRKYGCVCK